MFRTKNMIPCPYTDDVQHRWVLGSSGMDDEETLQVVCKECGHIAYSAHTPGLRIDADIDVRVSSSTVFGYDTAHVRSV